MIGVSLRGIFTRKLRTVLTMIAILLGVAMISGTYVLTDTINHSFQQIFETATRGTDAVVLASQTDLRTPNGRTLPTSLLSVIRGVPGVASAEGEVGGRIALFGPEGKQIGGVGGAPTLLFSSATPPFRSTSLIAGHWPVGHEIAIDTDTVKHQHLHLGQTIGVVAAVKLQRFILSGITKFGSGGSLGGATLVGMPLTEAQAILLKRGRFDQIVVSARPDVTQADVALNIRAHIPASMRHIIEVKTGKQSAEDQVAAIAQGLNFLTMALLAFGFLAVFVGAFIIFNTFSITVAQRTREFGLLRTLGATRRQVLISVMGEALVVGIVASVVGLLLGLLLAQGLQQLFVSFGIDLPKQGTVVEVRTIVVSMLVGTIVTVVAGLIPAVRSTRVPPIAALREGVTLPRGRFARFVPHLSILLLLLGALLLAVGVFADISDTGGRLSILGAGVLILFLGVAAVSPRLVRPLAWTIGWPIERLTTITGRLARENTTRNPSRTAVTAAALMIGLALVGFVTIFAAEIKTTADNIILRQIPGDLAVSSSSELPMPQGVATAVVRTPGVGSSAAIKEFALQFQGIEGRRGRIQVHGVQPSLATVYRFQWNEGSSAAVARLGPHDALLDDQFASSHHLSMGSILRAYTPAGKLYSFTVRAIYKSAQVLRNLCISYATMQRVWHQNRDSIVLVKAASGVNLSTLKSRLDRVLKADYPVAQVMSQQDIVNQQDQSINQLLGLIYVLLAMSLIVSLFGIVNTLILSVYERTREIGMLRAIGSTRNQIRWMIRWESVITAVIGAVLGLLVGIGLAALVTIGDAAQGLEFTLPYVQLLLWVVAAAILGIVSAAFPARRAARLDVLQALAYE